jgi:hypothetical protein
MRDPLAHRGSRANLLGGRPDSALVRALSVETQVRADTPPAVRRRDERRRVGARSATRCSLYDASAGGVPPELHVYERGATASGLAAADPVLSQSGRGRRGVLRARGYRGAPDTAGDAGPGPGAASP